MVTLEGTAPPRPKLKLKRWYKGKPKPPAPRRLKLFEIATLSRLNGCALGASVSLSLPIGTRRHADRVARTIARFNDYHFAIRWERRPDRMIVTRVV